MGGYVGHSSVHPALLDGAREHVSQAIEKKLLIDGYVTHCSDDLELIMTHRKGVDNAEIHKFAWDTFVACTQIAKRLKLYGAGQRPPIRCFRWNRSGDGAWRRRNGVRRASERAVVVFMADKTSPGAWNLPLFQIYANHFNTAGLVIDPAMHRGFEFEVLDVFEKRSIRFVCPEDMYELLMFIGATFPGLLRGPVLVTGASGRLCDHLRTVVIPCMSVRQDQSLWVGADDLDQSGLAEVC